MTQTQVAPPPLQAGPEAPAIEAVAVPLGAA